MSYLVMARKWRPLTFEDVVNQEHVKVTLVNAIKAGRIAHAYLFSGPRGVGKTTIARILAKALNCDKGPTATPCNECPVCREITESRSLDVLEIDGASNRGIDEVRNLRENIKYAPLKSAYKIYIIDEVHMLTDQAFNALLKTLEEPPQHVVFIFATTAPQKVPATILSRCQRFDFRRISTHDIQEHLSRIVRQEGVPIDQEALALLAKRADGSMRDAQSLLDQVASFSDKHISTQEVRHLLGLVDQDLLFRIVDIISAKDVAAGLDVADRIIAEGVDLQEFFKSLAEHFRNMLVAKAAGDTPGLIDMDESGRQHLRKQAAAFSEEDLLRMIRIVSDHEFNLRRSPLPRLELEMALMRLIKMDATVTLKEIFQRLEQAGSSSAGFSLVPREEKKDLSLFEQANGTTPPQKPNPVPTASDIAAPAGMEPFLPQWDRVVKNVKKQKMTIGTFLAGGKPVDIEDNILTVAFPPGNGFGIDMINKGKSIISDVLKEELGQPYQLKCVIDETLRPASGNAPSSASPGQRERTAAPKTDLEHLWAKEPIIKKIMDEFNGEIVEE